MEMLCQVIYKSYINPHNSTNRWYNTNFIAGNKAQKVKDPAQSPSWYMVEPKVECTSVCSTFVLSTARNCLAEEAGGLKACQATPH